MEQRPIGVFDSGYGGLTVLREITAVLPGYDFIYMGDNARSPYGPRSYETVYQYTLEAVKWFIEQGCPLIILACNTASSKALRTIQQVDLPTLAPFKRVLGVIRPTAEVIGNFTKTNFIGIMGTVGTINSGSYLLEIEKYFPGIKIFQQACPMWVTLVENNELDTIGAGHFIKKDLDELLSQSPEIDAILLACTHYPLLINKIKEYLPPGIQIISQGNIIAKSFMTYLERHPEIDLQCSKNGQTSFYTTDTPETFDSKSTIFFGRPVISTHISL